MNTNTNSTVKLEDIFAPASRESLHDEKEIKCLFLEGSKVGKNIIKKTEQLKEAKMILAGIDMDMSIQDMKSKLTLMYNIYETGNSLEVKLGYLSRTNNKVRVLGTCYNLVVSKLDTLEILKSDFDAEIEGY